MIMLIGPTNRYVFRCNRVVTKMTPVGGHRQVQRTTVVFNPPAFGRDRIVSGASTRGESEAEDYKAQNYKDCKSHGLLDTHRIILDHPHRPAV